MGKLFVAALIAGFCSSISAIHVDPLAGQTAESIALSLLGTGFSISTDPYETAVINANPDAIGLYGGATVESQGNTRLESGLVLSTGSAGILNENKNTLGNYSLDLEKGGDADLDALLGATTPEGELVPATVDATSIEFWFTLDGGASSDVSLLYIFGSEEYPEYVGSAYNDIMGIFLDGENIATIPDVNQPVCINNLFTDANEDLFNDNSSPIGSSYPYATEMDGFSVPLEARFSVTAGKKYHLKIVIADAHDVAEDSWLFVDGTSTIHPLSVPEPETTTLLMIAGLLLLSLTIGLKTSTRKRSGSTIQI